MKDKPWPVIVHIGSQQLAVLMNRKAYQKSLESGIPWLVHPSTERVLPWPGEPSMISIGEGPASYVLELPEGSDIHPYGHIPPQKCNPDSRDEVGNKSFGEIQNTLAKLGNIIAKRHQSMPEGAYTTHLFSSGTEKIRKKLGEEAIELVLATTQTDVIYESADLIYHLLVLLEAMNLKWTDVEAELLRRNNQHE